MKNLTKELYDAYLAVCRTDFKDENLYRTYVKLGKEFLGEQLWDDELNQATLIVKLTKEKIKDESESEEV